VVQPTLITSWTRTAFDAAATDTLDLSVDTVAGNLALVDRVTQKFYRIDRTTGAFISSFDLSDIATEVDFAVGVATSRDGTIFVLNRSDLSVYNYNELSTASTNPGFIARDLFQSFAGKKSGDFDISWNETSRNDLSAFKARLYVGKRTTLVKEISKMLQNFNTAMFLKFGKLALFFITFDNFKDDGDLIREGDIAEGSFTPSKEINQYFNAAFSDFRDAPFSGDTKVSDTYISSSGVSSAGKQIQKALKLLTVYRRADLDVLMPLFVRLAAAEPEFLKLKATWRLLFTQAMDFRRISFTEAPDCVTGLKKGGRRFDNIPAFVRKYTLDLENMGIELKMWSLGTTAFGNFVPSGNPSGGDGDKIVLTNLGVPGFISPIGVITASAVDSVTLEDVGGDNAEDRLETSVGNAWVAGYRVEVVDTADMTVQATLTILSVSGQVVTFTANHGLTIQNSVKNLSGFVTTGYILQYAKFGSDQVTQKGIYAYYGRPEVGYPASASAEVDEQKSGAHNFDDGNLPYVLHPKDFIPGL